MKESQKGGTEQESKTEQERQGEQELPGPDSPQFTPLALFLGAVLDQLPRQIYLYFHLRMPALYWSRVSRILQDARKSVGEIKGEALATARAQGHERDRLVMEWGWATPARSHQENRFGTIFPGGWEL